MALRRPYGRVVRMGRRAHAVLADTLAVSTAVEARRRLAQVLEFKERADGDPARRDAFQRAADDLRAWAATVYLAALREPHECLLRPADRPGDTRPPTTAKPRNPYTEESISLRRSVPRPPFPDQRKRRPFDAGAAAETQDADPPPDGTLAGSEDSRRAIAFV